MRHPHHSPDRSDLIRVLQTGLDGPRGKLDSRLSSWLAVELAGRALPAEPGRDEPPRRALTFLRGLLLELRTGLEQLSADRQRFETVAARATSRDHLNALILEHARSLGSSGRELQRDEEALERHLDVSAIRDRYALATGRTEQRVRFVLGRIGAIGVQAIAGEPATAGEAGAGAAAPAFKDPVSPGTGEPGGEAGSVGLDEAEVFDELMPLISEEREPRIRTAALEAIRRLVAVKHAGERTALAGQLLPSIHPLALDWKEDTWLQCEALAVVQMVSEDTFGSAARARLGKPRDGDDIFVRRRLVQLARSRGAGGLEIAETASTDPSPFVRQEAARAGLAAGGKRGEAVLFRLALEDSVPEVRVSAILDSGQVSAAPLAADRLADLLVRVFRSEKEPLVLRAAIHVASDTPAGGLQEDARAPSVQEPSLLLAELARLHETAESLEVRRWAALAHERLWAAAHEPARLLRDALGLIVPSISPGRSLVLPAKTLGNARPELIGRVLSVLSQADHPLELELRGRWSPRLWRGHRFGFRGWRFLREMGRPSPDKRQGHRHTIGRHFRGSLRAPSAILAELAETTVPGEPLLITEEGGWRPFLPLLDDVLSQFPAGDSAGEIQIFTSEGVTTLGPPLSLWGRWKGRLQLTRRFTELAASRNWQSRDSGHPHELVESLRRLGYRVEFRPHDSEGDSQLGLDPKVTRFFPALLPFASEEFVPKLTDYFGSAYSNTLPELALFTASVTAVFAGAHLVACRSIRRARKEIPLSVGGWGTRGKSGTERLKAAVFSALGYSVVSKTTGCEAMFLYSLPQGQLREFYLYRPYDKATIWEQRDILVRAARLEADVFLWECMALRPEYVSILQRQWMGDDLATITNTYPDHEDVQGPAGVDIPKVMTRFIPQASTLLTTEDQMLPVLAEEAKAVGTKLITVDWREQVVLPRDVLDRFPYVEHPSNIALVMAMARQLGIEEDYAVKEMADRVISDIGVLQVFPEAAVLSRSLQFSAGMSANERRAALGNWNRLGFDRQDYRKEPGVWVTTVINNRADRIPRSQVFASLVAQEISADRHFLIGSNLGGLTGYLESAWQQRLDELELFGGDDEKGASVKLEAEARWLRIPITEEDVLGRLKAMLEGLGVEPAPDELEELARSPEELVQRLHDRCDPELAAAAARHLGRERESLKSFTQARQALDGCSGSGQETAQKTIRTFLKERFMEKLDRIEDYHITGDQLVRHIVRATPPGYRNRILGMQNIKGPGLGFVTCWQAWAGIERMCGLLESSRETDLEEGVALLSAIERFNLLSLDRVDGAVGAALDGDRVSRDSVRIGLELIADRVSTSRRLLSRQDETRESTSGWFGGAAGFLEAFLDAGDAMNRRWSADTIYEDLVHRRIGLDRAAELLQAVTKRQKGGWVLQKLEGAGRLLRTIVSWRPRKRRARQA